MSAFISSDPKRILPSCKYKLFSQKGIIEDFVSMILRILVFCKTWVFVDVYMMDIKIRLEPNL